MSAGSRFRVRPRCEQLEEYTAPAALVFAAPPAATAGAAEAAPLAASATAVDLYGPVSTQVGAVPTFSGRATVNSTGAAVPVGTKIEFLIDNLLVASTTTNAYGGFSKAFAVGEKYKAGTYTLKAKLPAQGRLGASSDSDPLHISEAYPTITVPQNLVAAPGQTVRIQVSMTRADGKPIDQRLLTITFNGTSYRVRTDVNGVAAVNVKVPKARGSYAIQVSFAGDPGYYRASSASGSVRV